MLTLRRSGLSSPAYRDWLDYVFVEDGHDVGRVYEDQHESALRGASDGNPTDAASLLLARCDCLAENKAAPECPGPSYPNGAAAYQHAGIIPRLGAHTPFANSIARASRRIQGRIVCLTAPADTSRGRRVIADCHQAIIQVYARNIKRKRADCGQSQGVKAGGDPIELGLVASISRPGGNITAANVACNGDPAMTSHSDGR